MLIIWSLKKEQVMKKDVLGALTTELISHELRDEGFEPPTTPL